MIDYALTSLQPVAQQPVAPAGLLHAPGQDIAFLAFFGFVGLMSLCLMPGQLRESAIALFAPVRRFLRSLCCPWLWEGVFVQSFLAGAYRGDLWCNIGPPEDDPMPDEQDWISADDGLVVPCLT